MTVNTELDVTCFFFPTEPFAAPTPPPYVVHVAGQEPSQEVLLISWYPQHLTEFLLYHVHVINMC